MLQYKYTAISTLIADHAYRVCFVSRDITPEMPGIVSRFQIISFLLMTIIYLRNKELWTKITGYFQEKEPYGILSFLHE